jgi:hypothetical protein
MSTMFPCLLLKILQYPAGVLDPQITRQKKRASSGKLYVLFLLFLLERPQKWKTNVRKNLPSRFVDNINA